MTLLTGASLWRTLGFFPTGGSLLEPSQSFRENFIHIKQCEKEFSLNLFSSRWSLGPWGIFAPSSSSTTSAYEGSVGMGLRGKSLCGTSKGCWWGDAQCSEESQRRFAPRGLCSFREKKAGRFLAPCRLSPPPLLSWSQQVSPSQPQRESAQISVGCIESSSMMNTLLEVAGSCLKNLPYCILFPHLRALSHGHLCGSSSYTLDSFFRFCPGYWHVVSEFPDQGLNPYPAAVEVCSPNHWTTRELLGLFLLTAAWCSTLVLTIPLPVIIQFTLFRHIMNVTESMFVFISLYTWWLYFYGLKFKKRYRGWKTTKFKKKTRTK